MENKYNDYVNECYKLNSSPLSEDEFNGKPSLRFMPPAIMGAASNTVLRTAINTARRISQGENVQSAAVNALKDEGMKIVDQVSSKQRQSLNLGSSKFSGIGSGSGSNDVPSGSSSDGGDSGSKLLGIYTPNPLNITLSTGINPRIYADIINEPTQQGCFNHLTGMKFQLNASSTYLKDYISNVLVPYLQNKVQMSVSFAININTISSANLIDYIDKITNALQTYYFFARILSYTSIPTNPDRGMFALRQMISAADIDLLSQLKSQLQAYPIPPNLNKLCFWLMQNYTDGKNSQSVLGFMPIPFAATSNSTTVTAFDSNAISTCINNLSSLNSSGLAPLLSRCLPSWVLEEVYDPSPILVYDENWMNVWANAPYATHFASVQYWGPNVTDENSFFTSFNVFNDEPDGLSIGLQTVGLGAGTSLANQVWSNNLLALVNSNQVFGTASTFVNRFSYTKPSSSSAVWRNSSLQIESAFGRPETRKMYESNVFYSRIPDTIMPVNMNVRTANFVGRDVVTWCMSLDTIANKPEKKYYDSSKPKNK